MRILVVNWLDLENPQAGGAEIHLHEIFGRLAGWGHHVSVLASGWVGADARARADGMDIHRVGSRYTFPLHARRYYRRALEEPGFDVLVEDLNKVPLFTPRWGPTPVVPLVHHLFGRTAFREAAFPVALATVLLEHRIPRVFRGLSTVAVSGSTRDDLVRRGLRREDITVIPNGVDLAVYHPDAAVARFPEPTLLYLGRLKRYKRVDLLLAAVARLRDQGVAVRLLVGGKGDHREALEREAERLGLGDRVRFLGFVSREEKIDLMRRSWIHLLTSPKEGWGIVNLEAAACGTPTVASDAPGLRDSVRDGITGFLVPHGDVDALARRVRMLLEDRELRDRLGRGALEFARDFSWEASARAMEGVLSRAVRGEGHGRVARPSGEQ
ncbi:MAG TPA: glycosyltransferase family 4 protein [Longimicrobiales bacterium]|nr:glycosyltransferase family 4 protein [Longimicrobiales bacterium]